MPIVIDPSLPAPTAPTSAASSDGKITATLDPGNNGVMLHASGFSPAPQQVRFLRGSTPIRSGDPAWAPGGAAWAYDHEAPTGPCSWVAVPLYRTSTGYATGTPSAPVVLTMPDQTYDQDFYLKCIADPNLSLRLTASGDDPATNYTGRTSLSDVLGSPVLAGSWDLHTLAPRTYTFSLADVPARDALLRLLDAGVVLVQALTLYGIADYYAVAVDISETYRVGAYDTHRLFTTVLQPVARPGTAKSPLIVPGNTFASLATNYVSFDTLASRPSFDKLLA